MFSISMPRLLCVCAIASTMVGLLFAPATISALDREMLVLTLDPEHAASLQADILEFQRVVLDKGDYWFAGSSDMETMLSACPDGDDATQRACHLRAASEIGVTQLLRLSGEALGEGRFSIAIEVWSTDATEPVWKDARELAAESLPAAAKRAYPELAIAYLCWRGDVEAGCGEP